LCKSHFLEVQCLSEFS